MKTKCECKTVDAQEKIIKVLCFFRNGIYEEIGEKWFGAMKK